MGCGSSPASSPKKCKSLISMERTITINKKDFYDYYSLTKKLGKGIW